MTVNFPSSYDDKSSLYGDLDDLIVVTLNGAVNSTATALTFNETTTVDNLDTNTELIFKGSGQGPVTATAVLDDITVGGTYTGNGKKTSYRVEIDATGTPDTFKWSNDGGSTWVETGVSCVGSGSPYTLEEGITVYWAATTGHTLGDRWDWDAGFEIVRITSHGATGVLNVTRAFNGSTALSHADAAQATQDPTAYDFAILREAIIAAEKFAGLVGLDAAKPATCSPGQVYIATDTNKVYICYVANTWDLFNRPDHGQYANLNADDHTQYHTETRKITWHDALPGDHITTIAHDHSGSGTQGNPIRKFSTGLDANRGTPSVVGQVYYGYDQNNLYFSSDGSTWTRYTAMPKGTIMFFESSCPNGWTAESSLDLTFVKGANSGVWTGLTSGGATTHTHTMPDVISHSHQVSSQTSVVSSSDGTHFHMISVRNGDGANTLPFQYVSVGTATVNTTSAGAHTHTITIPAYTTDNSGSNPANSDSASNLVSYYKLIACRKD